MEDINLYDESLPLSEDANYSEENCYPVFIVLTHSGTAMANIVKVFTGNKYTHASISFDSSLDPMYTFGVKGPKTFGSESGFVIQNTKSEFYKNYKALYAVYVMYVNQLQYEAMQRALQKFIDKKDEWKYDLVNLVSIWLNRSSEKSKKYFCSRFVAEIINAGYRLDKVPSLYKPQELKGLNNITLVNKGNDLRYYDSMITDANLEYIKLHDFKSISVHESNGEDSYEMIPTKPEEVVFDLPEIPTGSDIRTILDNTDPKHIYFTSDWHISKNHYKHEANYVNTSKIAKWCRDNIKDNDVFFYLGDIAFRYANEEDQKKSQEIMSKIPGIKVFILGNHDKMLGQEYFTACGFDYVFEELEWKDYIFTHQPINMDTKPSNMLNIHGHIHNMEKYNTTDGKRNVNVYPMWFDNKPVTLDYIINHIDELTKNHSWNWNAGYSEVTVDFSEAMILPQKDLIYHKNEFDSGEINLAFVVGFSGSGKTTMARQLADKYDDCDYIELDDVLSIGHFSDDNLKEYSSLLYDFFTGPGKKYRVMYQYVVDNHISENEYAKPLIKDIIDYAISYAKSHKDKRFILEGIWPLVYGINPSKFKDCMVCIKGTSYLASTIRAFNRDTKDKPFFNKISYSAQFLKHFKGMGLDLNKGIKEYTQYFKSHAGKDELVSESLLDNRESDGTTFYRVSYDGIGIYEAYKNAVTPTKWHEFINSQNAKWLPKPSVKNYKDSYASYFTETGYNTFSTKVLPLFMVALDSRKINIEKTKDINLRYKVVYEDTMQIVIDLSKKLSSYNEDGQYTHLQEKSDNINYQHPMGNKLSTRSNGDEVSEILSGDAIDVELKNTIETFDIEKNKLLLESDNIVEDYNAFVNCNFRKNVLRKRAKGSASSYSIYFTYFTIEVFKQGPNISEDDIKNFICGDYYSVTDPAMIRKIIQLRVKYVEGIIAILKEIVANNSQSLDLTADQIDALIVGLSDDKTAAKSIEQIKRLIIKNKTKFIKQNGTVLDLRALGAGVFITAKDDDDHILYDKIRIKTAIQQCLTYDLVINGHGGCKTNNAGEKEWTINITYLDGKRYTRVIDLIKAAKADGFDKILIQSCNPGELDLPKVLAKNVTFGKHTVFKEHIYDRNLGLQYSAVKESDDSVDINDFINKANDRIATLVNRFINILQSQNNKRLNKKKKYIIKNYKLKTAFIAIDKNSARIINNTVCGYTDLEEIYNSYITSIINAIKSIGDGQIQLNKKILNTPIGNHKPNYKIGKYVPTQISESKRSELPDSSFGIPEDRKYPLDTEQHVRSAIKLFGHAEESKKKSLAKRIRAAAKRYDISIPETTQCYKYLNEAMADIIPNDVTNVIFDLGSVLVDYDYEASLRMNPDIPNEYISDIKDAVYNYLFFPLDPDDERHIQMFGVDQAIERFERLAPEHIKPYAKEAIESFRFNTVFNYDYTDQLIEKCKQQGYNIYYLSNWAKYTYILQKSYFDILLPKFNGGIMSYEVDMLKPDPEIYIALCDKYNLDPSKCMFFDDKVDNVEGAKRVGMQAYVFDHKTTPQKLLNEGINIPENADDYLLIQTSRGLRNLPINKINQWYASDSRETPSINIDQYSATANDAIHQATSKLIDAKAFDKNIYIPLYVFANSLFFTGNESNNAPICIGQVNTFPTNDFEWVIQYPLKINGEAIESVKEYSMANTNPVIGIGRSFMINTGEKLAYAQDIEPEKCLVVNNDGVLEVQSTDDIQISEVYEFIGNKAYVNRLSKLYKESAKVDNIYSILTSKPLLSNDQIAFDESFRKIDFDLLEQKALAEFATLKEQIIAACGMKGLNGFVLESAVHNINPPFMSKYNKLGDILIKEDFDGVYFYSKLTNKRSASVKSPSMLTENMLIAIL